MVFGSEGKTYDTADMKQYDTGDPAAPSIFVTSDGREVFVQTMAHWQGVGIHRAHEAEIRRLAEKYRLPELLKALG